MARAVVSAIGIDFGMAVDLVLVPAGTVPRTTSGKIRRRHCRELYATGRLTVLHRQVRGDETKVEAA